MPRFKVANFREQGKDLIIIPLDQSFEYKGQREQLRSTQELQIRALRACIPGTVIPVWERPSGKMGFIAPPNWHPFFESIGLDFVFANINKELYW